MKIPANVVASSPTERTSWALAPPGARERENRTVVLVVHDAVPQTTEPTVAETVESPGPKLKPVSVTHASSDIATLKGRH